MFSIILEIASQKTHIKYEDIQDKLLSIKKLLRQKDPLGQTIKNAVKPLYYDCNFLNEEELFYIQKQIIVEQIVSIQDALTYKLKHSKEGFEKYCYRTLKYIIPLLLSVIRSTICKEQLCVCYNQLLHIVQRVKQK